MRVAIIERNSITQTLIKKSLGNARKKDLWEIVYYIDPEKFLKEDKHSYDVVLVDCDLGNKVCFDFIHRV
jgi:hypothetical protein